MEEGFKSLKVYKLAYKLAMEIFYFKKTAAATAAAAFRLPTVAE